MYSYVVTSQKPTTVNHAVRCSFTAPRAQNIILGKGNYLEIRSFDHETNQLSVDCEFPINGTIASLVSFRPNNSAQDMLFVLTEHKHVCILSYDAASSKIITKASGNCKDRIGKELEFGVKAIVDPVSKYACMMLYEGLFKLIQLESSGFAETFNVRSDVISVIDIVFLHGCTRPTLAVLYEGVARVAGSNQPGRYLKTYVVNSREKEFDTIPWTRSSIDQTAYLLIPVPQPSGGLLVVGEHAISYINSNQESQAVMCQTAVIRSFGWLDDNGSRLLLGDSMGMLFVLVLDKNPMNVVTGVMLDYVGETCIPQSLFHLGNGIVFAGNVFGDSKLIRLLPSSAVTRETKSVVEDIETYTGIGPIVDMCVIDSDKQGQVGSSVVVTCSGAGKDGSVRVISSGIGITEQASIELPGINDMWSLRSSEVDSFDKYLVQSFTGETKILGITNEEMNEVEIPGFYADQSTLFCANVIGGLLVQVTPISAVLVDAVTFERADEYVATDSITVASANRGQIVLAISGGQVVYLTVDAVAKKLIYVNSVLLDQEVACISVRPTKQTESTSEFESNCRDLLSPFGASNLVALGMWTDSTIRLLTLPTLEEVGRQHVGSDTQARDILLITLEEQSHIFVGLGDGTLITFGMDFSSGAPVIAGRKRYALGTSALLFSTFLNNSTGALCVFISCDKPTILYTRRSKVLFSSVNIGETSGMSPFHSEMFQGCLAFSSPTGLLIGTVDDIQKIHIQSFPLQESPRRIAYHSTEGVFAVCTEQHRYTAYGVSAASQVYFFEYGTMNKLFTFPLKQDELAASCISCRLGPVASSSAVASSSGAADAMAVDDSSVEYIVIGTVHTPMGELDSRSGRVLIFEIVHPHASQLGSSAVGSDDSANSEKIVRLVFEKEFPAGILAVCGMRGRLAVGVGPKVHLFNWVCSPSESSTKANASPAICSLGYPQLQVEASHTGHVMCMYLKAAGDFLLVGDLVRSMTVLQYRDKDSKLVELSRDFGCNSMRAIEILGDGSEFYLGADDSGNLIFDKRNNDAVTEEERSKLIQCGEYHLGDYVNVLHFGLLNGQPIGSDSNSVIPSFKIGEHSLDSCKAFNSGSNGSSSIAVDNSTGSSSSLDSSAPFACQRRSILAGTVHGAIHSIFLIDEETFRFFQSLEKAMRTVIQPIGGLAHEEFRKFCNERRTSPQKNVVDGDIIEHFLDISPAEAAMVVRQLNEDLSVWVMSKPSTGKRSLAAGGHNISSASGATQSIFTSPQPISLSAEECYRRVEDMARLH